MTQAPKVTLFDFFRPLVLDSTFVIMCKSTDDKEKAKAPPPTIQELLTLAKVETPLDLSQITKLDLPDCGLSALPDDFATSFPNLSILFLSKNNFTEVPAVIGECPNLQMVAFRHNQVERIDPDALQPQMRWLILTNNCLTELPETIGRCTILQKLMLCGNQLTALPDAIENCKNLELIRMASNRLTEPPLTLLKLPKLSWVALSNNPFLMHAGPDVEEKLPLLNDVPETEGEILGQGAGGVTRKVNWNGKTVAVKVFGGAMTSDGLPSAERRISCVASHITCDCHIDVYGETPSGALVMEYLDKFHALANSPSFETCSRDVYTDASPSLTWPQGQKLLSGLLTELVHLHHLGICHGDFYGHNILVSEKDPSDVRLSDFGAAFFYEKQTEYGTLLEQTELRAFAILIEEVSALIERSNGSFPESAVLTEFAIKCRAESASFESVLIWWKQKQLAALAASLDAELKPPPEE